MKLDDLFQVTNGETKMCVNVGSKDAAFSVKGDCESLWSMLDEKYLKSDVEEIETNGQWETSISVWIKEADEQESDREDCFRWQRDLPRRSRVS